MRTDIQVTHLSDRLAIRRDGKLVTNYVFRGTWRPYFWPLNTSYGSVVRGLDGGEHHNHYGLNLTYGRHATGGTTNIFSDYDVKPFGPCGRMLHEEFHEVRTDDDSVRLDETTTWTNGTGHTIARDFRSHELRFLPDGGFVIQIRLELPPPADAEPGELRLFARIADELRITPGDEGESDEDHVSGQMIDSNGNRDESGTRDERAHWIDYSGHFEAGGTGGIALLVHPDNPDYPAKSITRNYGPFSTCQNFASDEPHVFKWGAYVHDGLTEDVDIEGVHAQFAEW